MVITLPWPDKRLSPNARGHWTKKQAPKRNAKIDARYSTLAAKGYPETRARLGADDAPIPMTITFYPPDRRLRDDDNMIGSLKAARDAVAETLGVDDRRFRPTYKFAEPEKPGRVEVSI